VVKYRWTVLVFFFLVIYFLAHEIKDQQRALNHMLYQQYTFTSEYGKWAIIYIHLIQGHLPNRLNDKNTVCRVAIELDTSGIVRDVNVLDSVIIDMNAVSKDEDRSHCNDVIFAIQSINQFPMPSDPRIAKRFLNMNIPVSNKHF